MDKKTLDLKLDDTSGDMPSGSGSDFHQSLSLTALKELLSDFEAQEDKGWLGLTFNLSDGDTTFTLIVQKYDTSEE